VSGALCVDKHLHTDKDVKTDATPPPLDVARLRRQDEAEFRRLVEEHQKLVLGLGASMGLGGAELDDAAAEAFANVYRSLPGFEGKSAIGTWIFRIASRALLKARQRRDNRTTEPLPIEARDQKQAAPDEAARTAERDQRLWTAVARLEPRQAMAVELFYRRDWSVEQIAEAMACPTGTVKTHLHRARERLREILSEEDLQS
jgi:RNA polymerase sigma-70 factor (ECF subfamily)